MSPPHEERADGCGEQKAGGGDRTPRLERGAGVRVEDGEVHRPERVDDVGPVRAERIADPERRREALEILKRSPVALGRDGNRADRRHQGKERELFENGAAQPSPFPALGLRRVAQAPERPFVEEQQDEGPGDEGGLRHQPQGETAEHGRIEGPPAADEALVGEQGEHGEQAGEDVLASRRPRHGFDVQGMQREHRGDERAPPAGARHALEREEEQHRIRDVENQAREMEARWIPAVECEIDRPREPRQREPIRAAKGGERPGDGLDAEAALHVGVVQDVEVVVVVDEAVVEHRQVGRDRRRSDHQRDPPCPVCALQPHVLLQTDERIRDLR